MKLKHVRHGIKPKNEIGAIKAYSPAWPSGIESYAASVFRTERHGKMAASAEGIHEHGIRARLDNQHAKWVCSEISLH